MVSMVSVKTCHLRRHGYSFKEEIKHNHILFLRLQTYVDDVLPENFSRAAIFSFISEEVLWIVWRTHLIWKVK